LGSQNKALEEKAAFVQEQVAESKKMSGALMQALQQGL
jgi:hypothetical protein